MIAQDESPDPDHDLQADTELLPHTLASLVVGNGTCLFSLIRSYAQL
jgi:hypothetical protein